MNTHTWTHHFITNRDRFVMPELGRNETLPEHVKTPLRRSLAVFQLGESGGGTRLMTYVRKVVRADKLTGYEEAVQLFVEEEQRHARLLAEMVRYLEGDLLQKQWTNSIFRWLRNHFGVEFNIQVLLIAELVAEVYFGMLYRRLDDKPLRSCCHRLLSDEMRHIAFHTEFLRERLEAMPAWWRSLWRAQFWCLHRITAAVVAWDHRDCLAAANVGRLEFCRMTWKSGSRFLRRLRGPQKLWGPKAGSSTSTDVAIA